MSFEGYWRYDMMPTFPTKAAGSKVLGLASVGLAVVRFKQQGVHHTDAAETTGVIKTAECNTAKPDLGKAAGSSMPFPADVTINQILRIN